MAVCHCAAQLNFSQMVFLVTKNFPVGLAGDARPKTKYSRAAESVFFDVFIVFAGLSRRRGWLPTPRAAPERAQQ